MAFKMTPGIKGNPAQQRVQALGACGGEGQPPCEPLFEKEKQERKVQTFKRAKIKKVEAPAKEVNDKLPPVKIPPKDPTSAFPVAKPVIVPIEETEGEKEKPVFEGVLPSQPIKGIGAVKPKATVKAK